MPATYTHYRYGKDILHTIKTLDLYKTEKFKNILEIINDNKEVFLIGLHGPDILFYHKPLTKNEVKATGHRMHEEKASDFFKLSKKIVNLQMNSSDEFAYVLGFVCHYALDSECHTYVEHMINTTGITHTEIEMAFDKMLMIKDGLDPNEYNIAKHIETDLKHAKTIGEVLSIDDKKVKKSLVSIKRINGLLMPGGAVKDFIVKTVLKLSGDYKQLRGMLVGEPTDSMCDISNKWLMEKYESSIPLAIELMENYYDFTVNNAELSEKFDKTFSVDEEKLKEYGETL